MSDKLDGQILYASDFNNKANKTDLDNKQDKITDKTNLVVNNIVTQYITSTKDIITGAIRLRPVGEDINYQADLYIGHAGSGFPVKITNLDDGTSDTDAVTVKQLNKKQDILLSGSTIKTINGETLLGPGNIQIQGGGGSSITVDSALSTTSENPVQNNLNNKQDKFATLDSTNKKINLNVDYSTIGVNEGALISFGSELVLNAISNIRVTSPVLMQTTNIHNDNYTITWDATNEAIKITFHE